MAAAAIFWEGVKIYINININILLHKQNEMMN